MEQEDSFDGFDVYCVGAEVVHGPLHVPVLGAASVVEAVGLEFRRDAFVELGEVEVDEAAV